MAEHELYKIVDDDGEVFNLRDSTKLPKTTNASEIISSAYPQCFYSTSYYSSGYVLFYDVTSAFDGTFASVTYDNAHVAFSGFVQSAKYNGYGEPQFFKVEGKVNGKYPTNYNASTSKTYGPVVLKRTYEEDGVTKERYYFAVKVPSNFNHGMMFFGVFHTKGQSGTALSWDDGFLGNLVLSTDTEYSVHWSWTAGNNVAASLFTARKLKTNLARTSDSTFDGSADQLNIPVTGTLPVGNGGTGKSSVTSGNYLVGNGTSAFTEKTPKDAGSDVLKSLDTDNGDVVDGDYIVTSYHVDASTISSTTFVRRTAEKLWNYIKSKISSVLGLSTTGYTGNAATATALEAGGADRVKLDGIEPSANNYVHPTSAGNKHVPSGGSDGKFLGYGGSSGTAAWVDNPASGKADDVSFVFTANGADANLNARLLAAVKLSGSTLSSVRLSFVMAVDIGIGSSGVKGGILRADIAVSSDGNFFAKKCWLTAVTGILSSSDFKIAYGSVSGGNMAVGVVHDGTLADGRSLYVRVLDSYVSGGDLVTNAAITAGKTYEAWGSVGQSADDGAVVHKTGDESVGGKKTFTDPVVESVSTSGEYGGFFVQRGSTAATRYRASLEVVDSGSRGLYDYGGSSYAGEDKWIIRKNSDNYIDVGEASNRNKVRLGGVTLDFSGTVGNVADTFYIAN